MKTITQTSVLFFYDRVLVFEGRDAIGGNYIAALVEGDDYVVAGVTYEMLRKFKIGAVDLRSLFTERPEPSWYIGRQESGSTFVLDERNSEISNGDILPESGFKIFHEISQVETLTEARARNNLVCEISIEPPEAVNHRVHAETFGKLLTIIQGVLKHAYHSALRGLNDKTLSGIEREDAYIMDVVVPAAAGSFKFILEASQQPDLLGANEVARAFAKLDNLIAAAKDPALTLQRVKEERGHFAGSYMRLLQFLAQNRTGLSYSWAVPHTQNLQSHDISEAELGPLIEALSTVNNLGSEIVKLSGKFKKVDIGRGTWRILDETSGNELSGKSRDDGPTLAGITIESGRYSIVCEEVIEESAGNSREQRNLYITEIRQS